MLGHTRYRLVLILKQNSGDGALLKIVNRRYYTAIQPPDIEPKSGAIMTQTFNGSCQCGQTTFVLSLPHPLKCYAPRACDCDFCVPRNINWLSDPNGALTISPQANLEFAQHGSNQAQFWACSNCKTVVAVTHHSDDNRLIGAVNASRLQEGQQCKSPQKVSPKKLSGDRKAERWSKIWMPVVLP